MHSIRSSRPSPIESPSRGVGPGPDHDGAPGHPVDGVVGARPLGEHPERERDPRQEPLGVQDHDVEHTVVDGGGREQRHAGLQAAHVADHDGARPVPGELAAVDADLDPLGGEHQ